MPFLAKKLLQRRTATEATAVTWTAEADVESPPGGTTHTFTALSIGTASAGRLAVACIGIEPNGTGTLTVTMHVPDTTSDPTGTTMTQMVAAVPTGNTNTYIYACAAPTGTSAAFKLTWTGTGLNETSISIFDVKGCKIASAVTATDLSVTSNALSVAITCSTPGVLIGAAYTFGSPSARTHTWTNLTESNDNLMAGGAPQTLTSGYVLDPAAGSRTVTCTASGNITNNESALALCMFLAA